MAHRKPSEQELALIGFLVSKADKDFPADWKQGLFVEPMQDGGMGSLRLLPKNVDYEKRSFGKQISEHHFTDKDGVKVIASLNVDQADNLYELDVWKTDYSSLISLPENFKG